MTIAIPPIEEQEHILDLVHGVEEPINHAILKNREIITTLEDLKKRLIADVVTGKLDVRDIEIPEYEYVDEETDTDAEDDSDAAVEEQED